MLLKQIRNFSIIAHIDHGKSTLADRLLEVTGTIEKRKMREQVLDMMELERERGITIKMQPVRLHYQDYLLNLIDTPGHIDFSYEVSRSLKAVEGVLLLVDATQGVQAQTLSVLNLARDLGLKIIPVINKIDLPAARVEETKQEIIELLNCRAEDIVTVSGKTGVGVAELLEVIVDRIPPPKVNQALEGKKVRALVFDFEYSNHQGVIVYARVSDGLIKVGDELVFHAAREKFKVLEVGNFCPQKMARESLGAGEIGYLVTGIKQSGQSASWRTGDTIENLVAPLPPFPGYEEPSPVVWASIYPENQNDLPLLRQALIRLKLSDASLSFEEEASTSLGRGFRCGFLGLLHLEIITERLKREFNLTLVIATPTISYEIVDEQTGEKKFIYSPHIFPEDTKGKKIFEPWVAAKIIVPPDYAGNIIKLLNEHEAVLVATENFSAGRVVLSLELPLRELMRNFFDEIKSVSSGFASFSYLLIGNREADVARMDVLVNEQIVPAFSQIVSRRKVDHEGQDLVERLKKILPRQLISIKIQAKSYGRIVASRMISARRKDVTDYLYGGDITRKMKLREKQKKGKKKMQKLGSVNIPQDVFLKMINNSDN